MSEFDAKAGSKRWCSFLDEEANPLTEEQLAERSSEYRRGYCNAALTVPMTPEEIADRPERWRAAHAEAVERARVYLSSIDGTVP